jgi:hypothetical protein
MGGTTIPTCHTAARDATSPTVIDIRRGNKTPD